MRCVASRSGFRDRTTGLASFKKRHQLPSSTGYHFATCAFSPSITGSKVGGEELSSAFAVYRFGFLEASDSA